jgi:hypothetical protein
MTQGSYGAVIDSFRLRKQKLGNNIAHTRPFASGDVERAHCNTHFQTTLSPAASARFFIKW